MKHRMVPALLLITAVVSRAVGSAAEDAAALLDKTGTKGGLCLVIGAKDPALARELAARSALYIQVLQPDARLAEAWGAGIAASDCGEREKLGVRNAMFDANDYGSDLFNLAVVETATGLADVCRILLPRGCVAFRTAPAGAVAEAKALGMETVAVDGFGAVLRKPVKPVEWKPADSLKWRAGMRAHMANGVMGTIFGGGRYFYREFLEPENGWPEDTTQLVARDAYNGRVLWIKQEGVPRKHWNAYWARIGWTLGADDAGRLFVVTADGKLVCLDAATGEQRFELLSSGARPGYVNTWQDKYVLYGGTVFSAETGKALWKYSGEYTAMNGDTLVESDGVALRIRNFSDGRELVRTTLVWRASMAKKDMQILHLGSQIIIADGGQYIRPYRVTALNPATGEKLWSQELGGIFALPPKEFGGAVGYAKMDGKLLAYAHTGYFYVRGENQKEVHLTRIDLATGALEQEDYGTKGQVFGNACGTEAARQLGDWLFYHHNVWLNLRTFERRFPFLAHPACTLPPPAAYGMIYNSPGRKGHSIQGITAIGPADMAFDQAPGGKMFVRYAPRPAFCEPTVPGDWPTFRANNARGNATATDLGTTLAKAWEVKLGLGGRTYGQMNAERTGLTQPVIAYGLVYVSDISAQRIVALDQKDGAQRWVHHAGSRVDFPPTIYKGLCLYASKDGFVTCLDAKTGGLVYRLLAAPRERYIGGQEQLESLWPTGADVMVDTNGIGHVSVGFASTIHGGVREVAFKAETGEVLDSQVFFDEFSPSGHPGPKRAANIFTEPLAGGWRLAGTRMDDMLGYGNSISRVNEDRWGEQFGDDAGRGKGRARGRVIAFDETSCVAWNFPYGAESWAMDKPLSLMASAKSPKEPLWQSPPIELIADDIVLAPKYVYCVGHYRRVAGVPEIWVINRDNGTVLSKTPVDGFPAYLGVSAVGNRLLIATREGKLLCYEGR